MPRLQSGIKQLTDFLAVGIVLGFLSGLLIALDLIKTHRYMYFRMFRTVAHSVQRLLNINILIFAVLVLIFFLIYLYVRWLTSLTKTKANGRRAFVIVSIIAFFLVVLACMDDIARFAQQNYWFKLVLGILTRIREVMVGESSILFLFSLFWKHIGAILLWLLIVSLVTGLFWIVRRLKWQKNLGSLVMRLFKKTALVSLVCLVIFNIGIIVNNVFSSPEGPNVLLICVDTLRADHVGCYGYQKETTPYVDALAQDSLVFTNVISSAPWTAPSMAALFTSQHPIVLGFSEEEPVKIPNHYLTLGELFKEHKYKTKGIIGSNFVSSKLGFAQGFDSYDEDEARGHNYVSSAPITEKAIAFLERLKKNERFLLFLHYFDPHYDYILHEPYNYYPEYKGELKSGQRIKELRKLAPRMSEQDIQFVRALYESEIRYTDEFIGKLLNKLKELGYYDNTLIIFTSDHGEEFCERGDYWIGHTKTLYQELIRVPLILKLPGEKKNKKVVGFVGLIDMLPTIARLCGLKVPLECDGMVIETEGVNPSGNRLLISETWRRSRLRAAIWGGWKLVLDFDTDSKKLFDLKADPQESRNLSQECPDVLSRIKSRLKEWAEIVESKEIRAEQPKFTEEQKKILRSLGYIK